MKKHEFVSELTRALSSVDTQTRSEIIADINEHFAEGVSQGLTEEEICKNLGQPSQIAEQVLEEYRANPNDNWHQANNFSSSIGDLVGNIGEMVTNIVGDIGNHVGKNTDFRIFTNQNEFNNFEEFSDFSETSRVKGGYEINIDKSFDNVKNLDINLSYCELIILPAKQGETARVNIKGRSRYNNFYVENENGCLVINERYPKVRFEIFRFNTKLKAFIYLPTGFDGHINVKSNAGNITVNDLCGNLDLNATAGNINIDNHKSENARIKTSAGNIKLTNCGILDIYAKSSAGVVSVDAPGVGNLNLDSSAGQVSVRVGKLGGETRLASSAGAVCLEAHEVHGNITAKSSAGGIVMRLPKDVNLRIEARKPSIGSFYNDLTGNPHSPYVLTAVSSVGSIRLESTSQ